MVSTPAHLMAADRLMAYEQAGSLLYAVAADALEARTALLHWPRLEDPSLTAAYQALWHFAADQEPGGYHHTIPLYADQQLIWLEALGRQLAHGQPLSGHVSLGYGIRHRIRFYERPQAFWQLLRRWLTKHQ